MAALAALGVCVSGNVLGFAKEVTPQMEYGRTLKDYQSISPASDTPFGESINPITGELRFSQSDIVLKGLGPDIVLTRSTRTSQHGGGDDSPEFGDWDLSIPRIETLLKDNPKTTVPAGENWRVGISNTLNRCTQFEAPTLAMDDWWHGYDFITEDGGRQLILKRATENTNPKPTMVDSSGAAMVFPALTMSNWQIGCLPSTANGEPGEAYLAIAPDGTKYWLNYLVDAQASSIIEDDPDANRIHRRFATMMVTRIEDRFGNWVQYNYTGRHLQSITAKDGRRVSIAWNSAFPVIDSITVMPGAARAQVWRYSYTFFGTPGIQSAQLTRVQLPDGSAWGFSGTLTQAGTPQNMRLTGCDIRRGDQLTLDEPTVTATVTSPSGAVGTFVRSPAWRGRSYVVSTCKRTPNSMGDETKPAIFGAYVLTQRTISGLGLTPRTWTYSYPVAQASTTADACASAGNCVEESYVDIRDPAGNRMRQTFSTRWGITEGRVFRTDVYQGESTLLRTTTVTYAAPDQGPWPTRIGVSRMSARTAIDKLERLAPVVTTTTVQQGRVFKSTVQAFDTWGRPTKVLRTSGAAP